MWSLLPEQADTLPEVPDWPQFMRGCVAYRASLDAQCPQAERSSREYAAEEAIGQTASQTTVKP